VSALDRAVGRTCRGNVGDRDSGNYALDVYVEADEAYVPGGIAKNCAFKEPPPKEGIMGLVEREGRIQSFDLRVAHVTADIVKPIIAEVLSKATSQF
jgi:hypothetical protein